MKPINRSFFKNPVTDPEYSVSGFWFWNDLIEDDIISEQLGMMRRIHADQPVIHARFGLQNGYLNDDWFSRINHAIQCAAKNGQKLWLYDENNWPSGNCNWTITHEEKNREHFLQFKTVNLPKGKPFNFGTTEKKYIAASAFSAGGQIWQIGIEAGEAVFSEDTEMVLVYVDADPYEKDGKYSVDYLSHEAILQFLKSTHEKYKMHFSKYFGNIIEGFFMDETRFCNAMPWTEALPVEFKKRKGYDIVPFLPLLKKKGSGSDFIRYDYFDVISDLYAENTFKQIYDWCNKNGIKTTGHILGEETLAAMSYFGGDALRVFKYLHCPGIDHLGNGIGSLDAKFVSSAAHHYGKDRVVSESFGAAGWDISWEDMVRISNWLFQQGINHIIIHGFYYSIRDERADDFPPSYFFQWKYWDKMKDYVPMANRMMEMLSGGCHEADILVYSPIETLWTCYEPDLSVKTGFWNEGPRIADEQAAFIDRQFQLVCNSLSDENLDYEILGADAVPNFSVKKGKLFNRLSGASYSVLILPCVRLLTLETVKTINEFVNSGGLLIGYHSDPVLTVAKDGSHIREILPCIKSFKNRARTIGDIIALCRTHITPVIKILEGPYRMARNISSYPARLIDPYIHNGERVYGIGITRYLKIDARIFNITNYNENDEELRLCLNPAVAMPVLQKTDLSACSRIPEIFIPETGEIRSSMAAINSDGWYEFSLVIPQNRSIFIVCPSA